MSVPVEIDPDAGTTVDLSNSGLSFETSRVFSVGERLTLSVVLSRTAAEEPMRLIGSAEVVRVERHAGAFRVGAVVEWIQSVEGLRFDL